MITAKYSLTSMFKTIRNRGKNTRRSRDILSIMSRLSWFFGHFSIICKKTVRIYLKLASRKVILCFIGKNFFWDIWICRISSRPKKLFPKFLLTLQRPHSLRSYLGQMIWLRSSTQKISPISSFFIRKII